MVAVIPIVPGQSKIAALEAALRCLADSLQEARLQAIPDGLSIPEEGAASGGEAGSKKTLEGQTSAGHHCAIPHHDVVVLNAGADDCGPAVVVYDGLKAGFLPQAIPQGQSEEMPPYVGAWCKPTATKPFRHIKDQRIFVVMNLLMHSAALLHALCEREQNEALLHPDMEEKGEGHPLHGKGRRGEYGDDFFEVAHQQLQRLRNITIGVSFYIVNSVQKVAGRVFEGTGHPLDRPLDKAKKEDLTDLFQDVCCCCSRKIKNELIMAKRQKTQ